MAGNIYSNLKLFLSRGTLCTKIKLVLWFKVCIEVLQAPDDSSKQFSRPWRMPSLSTQTGLTTNWRILSPRRASANRRVQQASPPPADESTNSRQFQQASLAGESTRLAHHQQASNHHQHESNHFQQASGQHQQARLKKQNHVTFSNVLI